MTKIGLLSCLFLSASLCASELTTLKSYDKPLELSRSNNGYLLQNDALALHFPNHQVSKPIRDLRADQLASLLKSNAYYLKATQLSDGTHALDLQGRVQGGFLGGMAVGGAFGYEGARWGVIGVSVAGLFLAQGAVHVFAGPTQGAIFRQAITDVYLPNVAEFAERVAAPVGAVIGAGVAAVASGPV